MWKKVKKWWWAQRLDLVMCLAKILRIKISAPHLGQIPSYVIKK